MPFRSMGDRRDALFAAALAAMLFTVYAAGACPTIYVGDSGELVAAVDLLGIPHPTGYPLYVLLGKLWTLLVPFGSIAYRMSLFSSACAAVACAWLFRCCRNLGLHPAAALTAAGLLAFGHSFWAEANVQRVYSLSAVFVVGATSAALRWQATRAPRSLVLAFFLCGLGATNHTFMGVYAFVLAAFAVASEPRIVARWRTGAACAAAPVAGLLPYAYLPLRSRMNPRLDWGNPETLDAFLGVVLRRGFWVRAWLERPSDFLAVAADYLSSIAHELTWAGAALVLAGLIVGLKRRRVALLAVLVMIANLTVMALHGSRSDLFIWHRYYIPSYAMAALLAGLGTQWVIERLPSWGRIAPIVVPVFLLAANWQSVDRSRYRIAEAFSLGVLRSLPPGASLIATDDNILFVLIYLNMVEGHRPDVNLILQGVGQAELPPLHFNPDTDPLFFTHHPNWNLPSLDIVPVGLVFRAWRAGEPAPDPTIPFFALPGENDPGVPKDYLTQNLVGHLHYMLGFTFEQRDWLRAREEFGRAAASAPHNDVLFYNLGLIYQRNGLLDEAIAAFRRSEDINPRHLATQSRPRAADRVAELERERARLEDLVGELAAGAAGLDAAAGSPAYHLELARLLEARGEPVAARGQRLRALEKEAGLGGTPFVAAAKAGAP